MRDFVAGALPLITSAEAEASKKETRLTLKILDYNSQNEYNRSYDKQHEASHFSSFRGLNFCSQGGILRQIPHKIITNFPKHFLDSSTKVAKLSLIALSSAFLLTACSGKVQTNKIPNDTRYHLPSSQNHAEPQINTATAQEFNDFLQDFFNVKESQEQNKSIYYIGINRGHFVGESK